MMHSPLVVLGASVCLVALLAARVAPTSRRDIPEGASPSHTAPAGRVRRAGAAIWSATRSATSRWRRGVVIRPGAVAVYADDVARSIRRGVTLRQSVLDVTSDDALLDEAVASLRFRLERGEALSQACTRWIDDVERLGRGGRNLVALGSVIGIAASVGGRAGEPLDRLAASMRQFAADDLERAAQSAQARVSARVLTILPLGVLAVMGLSDADVRTVAASPSGSAVVGVGLVLNGVGALWMRSIVQRGAAT